MAHLRSGDVVADRFEVLSIAGTGGMGAVYRARDRISGSSVALKLIQAFDASPEEEERFKREAQILAQIRHPNIVSFVAYDRTPSGQPYLVMEWLEGEDLASRLSRGPLSLRDTLLLIGRVADALAVVHRHGIVHRDIKP